MPDAKPWEEYAAAKGAENGPWEEYAQPPKSLAETTRGSGFAKGLVGQVGRFGRGIVETAKAVSPLVQPTPVTGKTGETLKGLGRGVGEMFAAPARELVGKPQPGEVAPQALPTWERLTAPFGTALGADPAEVRRLEAEGKTGEAWAARLVAPALNLGLLKLLRWKVGETAPPPDTRAAKLGFVTGKIPKQNVEKLTEQVMPRIDKAAKTPAARPAGLPENQPWNAGKFPTTPEEYLGTANAAITTIENEFNLELQKSAALRTIPQKAINNLDAAIAERPSLGQTLEGRQMLEVLEARKLELMKPWTYQQINAERSRLYRLPKGPAAARQDARISADLIADKAIQDGLRDIAYDQVESTSGRPAYFRKLKQDEHALIYIKDQLRDKVNDLAFVGTAEKAQEIGRLRKWLGGKTTVYINPATGKPHMLFHPLRGGGELTPTTADKLVTEAFKGRPGVTRPRQIGAAALMGRVPSRESEPSGTPITVTGVPIPSPETLESVPFAVPSNNNPGNIKTPSGEFKRYPTPEAGWADLHNYLTRATTGKHNAYSPGMSLGRFFEVYAPKADNNNPKVYAATVAKRLGVPVTTPISLLTGRIPEWAAEINRVEWGVTTE